MDAESGPTVDLTAPMKNLQLGLHYSMELVGHCLRALESYADPQHGRLPSGAFLGLGVNIESHVPDVPLAMQLGPPLGFEQAKRDGRLWILRKGTGELVTKLGSFCLQAHAVGNIVRLAASSLPVTGQAFSEAAALDSRAAKKFDRLVWTDKFPALRALCGVAADPALDDPGEPSSLHHLRAKLS